MMVVVFLERVELKQQVSGPGVSVFTCLRPRLISTELQLGRQYLFSTFSGYLAMSQPKGVVQNPFRFTFFSEGLTIFTELLERRSSTAQWPGPGFSSLLKLMLCLPWIVNFFQFWNVLGLQRPGPIQSSQVCSLMRVDRPKVVAEVDLLNQKLGVQWPGPGQLERSPLSLTSWPKSFSPLILFLTNERSLAWSWTSLMLQCCGLGNCSCPLLGQSSLQPNVLPFYSYTNDFRCSSGRLSSTTFFFVQRKGTCWCYSSFFRQSQ